MIRGWKEEGLPAAEIVRRAARECIGWPYVFGAWGEKCTPAARGRRKREDYPTIESKCRVLSGKDRDCGKCPWGIGVRMFDCRGFTKWLLEQAGIGLEGAGATSQWNNAKNWAVRGEKKDLPEGIVACVFKKAGSKMNHTGMHIGGGEIIHCSSGVQSGKISAKGWTHFAVPNGLYEDGELPEITAAPTTLRKGARGEDVKRLQERLTALGYDVGKTGADGIFGERTLAAVRAFQKDRGLAADGIVGAMTWKEILGKERRQP